MADRISPIERVQKISPTEAVQGVKAAARGQTPGRMDAAGQFGALLQQEIRVAEPAISFSKHAQSRAAERGIQVDVTLMGQLADSV